MNLSQDQQSIRIYFTKLKTIREKLIFTDLFAIVVGVHIVNTIIFRPGTRWAQGPFGPHCETA